jgi:MFS family permease
LEFTVTSTPVPPNQTPSADSASTGELVSRLSTQMSTLIRDEMRLAQAEVKEKGKKAGIGVGLFGGAGLIALFGVGALVAAAILGLATAVAAWLAAIIVGVVLLLIAGVLALTGKKEVSAATPPLPQEAIAGLKADVGTVKESAKR